MKVGLHEWATERKSDFITNLKFTHKYGYECMELLQKNTDEYLETHTMEEMKAALSEAQIRPSALSGLIYFNLLKTPAKKEAQFREFERLLAICKGIGCEVLIMVASPKNGEDDAYIEEDAVAVLKEYAEIAEKENIKLAVEFLGFKWASINNFKSCYSIIRKVNKENVGIALDCFHFYANGSSIDDLRKADGSKIFALHIDDCTGRAVGEYEDDSLRVLPFDGEIPLVEIFKVLKEIGVKQTPCMELFNEEIWNWEPETAIRIFKEKTLEVMQQSEYEP